MRLAAAAFPVLNAQNVQASLRHSLPRALSAFCGRMEGRRGRKGGGRHAETGGGVSDDGNARRCFYVAENAYARSASAKIAGACGGWRQRRRCNCMVLARACCCHLRRICLRRCFTHAGACLFACFYRSAWHMVDICLSSTLHMHMFLLRCRFPSHFPVRDRHLFSLPLFSPLSLRLRSCGTMNTFSLFAITITAAASAGKISIYKAFGGDARRVWAFCSRGKDLASLSGDSPLCHFYGKRRGLNARVKHERVAYPGRTRVTGCGMTRRQAPRGGFCA